MAEAKAQEQKKYAMSEDLHEGKAGKISMARRNKILKKYFNIIKVATKRMWVISQPKGKKSKITDAQKNAVSDFFEPLILQFKKELQKREPNKKYNYAVDIFTKWNQNYFYFCEKNLSETNGKITGEFETKFVRLEFVSENNFNFSYFRHNGHWFSIVENITLSDCLEMIIGNPNFQPTY